MDMNESASLAVAALAMNAETLANFVSAFAATGHYGDGMNLYQYAGGNPANRLDALGLFSLIELTWSSEVVLDESLDSMDRGSSFMDAFRGLGELIQERNLELDYFAEATGNGEQDAALAEFEQSQIERSHARTPLS